MTNIVSSPVSAGGGRVGGWGEAKNFEAFLKRVGLVLFNFLGVGLRRKGDGILQGGKVENFQLESLNQLSNISFCEIKAIRYFLFSHQ